MAVGCFPASSTDGKSIMHLQDENRTMGNAMGTIIKTTFSAETKPRYFLIPYLQGQIELFRDIEFVTLKCFNLVWSKN